MARILILEDEPSWNASLLRSLKGYHELVVVGSSSAALQILDEQRFDVIITRVHLKNDNVFVFLKDLKANPALAGVPVICFCGVRSRVANISNDALDKATKLYGANAYIALEDFCVGEECDFESIRRSIEEAIKAGGSAVAD